MLHGELKLTRMVLERSACEAAPMEIATHKAKLAAFYTYPEQLLFIDETAKKGMDAMRKYAWALRGKKPSSKFHSKKVTRNESASVIECSKSDLCVQHHACRCWLRVAPAGLSRGKRRTAPFPAAISTQRSSRRSSLS